MTSEDLWLLKNVDNSDNSEQEVIESVCRNNNIHAEYDLS